METEQDKICGRCGGPYWAKIVDQGVDIHNLGDCIEYLKDKVKHIRSETIRELDAKYNTYCEKKVNAAVEHMQKQLDRLEVTNAKTFARNQKLEIVKAAAGYCYRNGHIDEAAVLFTGLDKALLAIE